MSETVPSALTGTALLHDPQRNRGTAFALADRQALHIEGLLPPAADTLSIQIARVHTQLAEIDSDLHKYLFLSALQSQNEVLFYAVLMSDPATFMPLVYTPTVGEACQKFDHIFRASRGMYLPITAKGRLRELLSNWPQPDVRFIVVTDGERILGLGDLGVGGMGIPVGKLALYTACAGVPPEMTLARSRSTSAPTITSCSKTRFISDCARTACAAPSTTPSSTSSCRRCRQLFPKCCLQWEDFANFNAVPILERYRNAICTYNDDIQGTAAVALAGILAALRITRQNSCRTTIPVPGRRFGGNRYRRTDQPGDGAGGLADRPGPGTELAVRHQRTDDRLSHRPRRLPEAVRARRTRRPAPSSPRSRRSGPPASSASARCRNCSIRR